MKSTFKIGRTDSEVEVLILWPPDAKSWFIRKDLDAGKDWGQEEKGTTEDEMVGWHHQLNGHEFEQALGDGDGQGSLVSKSWTWLRDWTMTKINIDKQTHMIQLAFMLFSYEFTIRLSIQYHRVILPLFPIYIFLTHCMFLFIALLCISGLLYNVE